LDKYKAAIDQLLIGLCVENMEQIKDVLESILSDDVGLNGINEGIKCVAEAMPDYDKYELTTAEKNLIAAYYRKAPPRTINLS
jgi:hypothetical protein